MKVHTVVFRNESFSYLDWGGADDVVHISHSIGLSSGVYTPFAKRLTDRFHVVGLDSRGHGLSKAPADPRKLGNWDILYDDLEAFLSTLNQPVIAIGHSMGGTLSLAVAVRRPDLISALIMIEPGIMPPAWRWAVFFLQLFRMTSIVPLVSRTAKRNDEWPSRQVLKNEISERRLYRNWNTEFLDSYVEHAVEETEQGSVRLRCKPAWEARCIAMAPTGIWQYVSRLNKPTLVLYGENSKTFLPSVAEKFRARVPHAVLRRFEGVGHDIIMESPEASMKTISDFLAAVI